MPLWLAAVAAVLALGGGAAWIWRRRGDTPPAQTTPEGVADLVSALPGMAYRGHANRGRTLDLATGCCEALLGWSPDSGTPLAYGDLIHPEDRDRAFQELATAVQEGRPYRLTYRILTRDGEERWVWDQGRALPGAGGRVAGFVTDFTEHKRAEERLLHDAFHDHLTGLPNRALFLDRLRRAVERAERNPERAVAVLCLDLDRFKVLNDSFGHQLGDQVLVLTARRLTASLRPKDTVARLAGNTFAILVDDVAEPRQAIRVAERILELLNLPIYLERGEVISTASLGIALSLSGFEQPDDLLRHAEIAMYRAKTLGGGRHELFDRSMHREAVAALRLEADLRRALARGELRLFYQPIVSLATGAIQGFEGLLRWQHPERGLLKPADFMSLATETGLMTPISWWVLREACSQVVAWQKVVEDDRPLYASINLTGKQFNRQDLVERIRSTLRETGLPPSCLRIEITESVVMDTDAAVVATLAELRELGIHLSMDDFGTGYSSLSYLRRLPLGSLKIDRSFTAAAGGKLESGEIVATIVELAHRLGMEVVAEGVETFEQLDILRELGCEYGQGFLFSEALESSAVEEMLEREVEAEQESAAAVADLKRWA